MNRGEVVHTVPQVVVSRSIGFLSVTAMHRIDEALKAALGIP